MWIDVDGISTDKISSDKTKIDLRLKILDYDYLVIDRLVDRLNLKFKEALVSSETLRIKKVW